MNKLCQVWFGCETQKEAGEIAEVSLDKKLIACVDGFEINSKYSWESKRVDEKRYQVVAYSILELKDRIINEIKAVHSDALPSIVFIPFEANEEYLKWIEKEIEN